MGSWLSRLRRPEVARTSQRSCLTEDQVLDFVRGRATESERDALHQHVDDCEPCRELLSTAARTYGPPSALTGSGPLTDFATTFSSGTLIAQRYEIRRLLARGGMGEVYEAHDRHLQERVAIKTPPSAACDSEQAIRAFKVEVQLARRVTHPNVCRTYDLGTHRLETGTLLYFLTMEFVEGQTLGQLIRERGAFPVLESERLARALLTGLAAAHRAGILHRDFKSDNVMVRTSEDGQRTPVILDFGLARALNERSHLSAEVELAGTFQYMAPEQLAGAPLSKATDIYAFGVVWFEMLTGRRPFSGSRATSVLARLGKSPAPPSHYDQEVSEAVDRVIRRCLRRTPSDRFQSAEEVLAALPNVKLPQLRPQ
jgi:eukaryotic-like serine/threonine-protein kinase